MIYALDPALGKGSFRTGILGAGTMGRGIAQISAAAGNSTIIYDSSQAALDAAKLDISKILTRNVEKKVINQKTMDSTLKSLNFTDDISLLSSCELVIEAIIEDMAIKAAVFRQLDTILEPNAVITTNTSSLSITALAASTINPERFAGLHFFNPVPLMKVVEVIHGPLTSPIVITGLKAWVDKTGHKAVTAMDSPGFIVNHAGRGYGTEALKILGETVASVEVVDQIMKDTGIFKMGPFELLDLIGLDTSHKVMESIYSQYYQEPRFRPSPWAKNRVDAKLLGRKSGRGFYSYSSDSGKKIESAAKNFINLPLTRKIWIAPMAAVARQKLEAMISDPAQIEIQESPSNNAICLVAPIGIDTTSYCKIKNMDPESTFAIDTLISIDKTVTVMATPLARPELADELMTTIRNGGRAALLIDDSPGFIAQRIIAMIVNIGCDLAQQGITTPNDLDEAVRLGLGYRYGPLKMGDYFGADDILEILDRLFDYYKDPRYRASPWLKRRVALGMSLTEVPRNRKETT